MRKCDRHVLRSSLFLAVFSCSLFSLRSFAGALEEYVSKPDTNYAWTVATNRSLDGFTVTHLKLTSQRWREGNWTHHVQVVRPEKIRNPQIGFLFITGDGDGLKTVDMLK